MVNLWSLCGLHMRSVWLQNDICSSFFTQIYTYRAVLNVFHWFTHDLSSGKYAEEHHWHTYIHTQKKWCIYGACVTCIYFASVCKRIFWLFLYIILHVSIRFKCVLLVYSWLVMREKRRGTSWHTYIHTLKYKKKLCTMIPKFMLVAFFLCCVMTFYALDIPTVIVIVLVIGVVVVFVG